MIRLCESETDKAIVPLIEEVAQKRGVSMACIAAAWCISKGACPIIGPGSKERMDEACAFTRYKLGPDNTNYVEEMYLPKPVQHY
jgi:aryl-alcohol dehydrogenase-like predicted oxidoreductase